MKMFKKRKEILLQLFIFIFAAIFFFAGYFLGKDNIESSYPVLKTIKLIERDYIVKFSPKSIKGLQYIAIKTIMGYLDPHSHFLASYDNKRNIVCSTEPIKTEIIDKTIGYIKIPNFRSGETLKEIKQIIDNLNQQNVKGLIIDLRDNPGGISRVAIKTAGLFLESDKVITTFKFRDSKTIYRASKGFKFDKPVVILINNKSASASELFSGALQSHKRAILIGTKTYGKGCGQKVFLFNDDSVLSLTAFKFYLPNGFCPQGNGILPDIVVDEPDLQLKKAIEILKQPIQ